VKIEMMFIGVLLFGLVWILCLNIYADGLSNYNVDVDTDSTFGKMGSNLKQIYDIQDSMKTQIEGGEVSDEDAVDEMIKGGYTSIRSGPFSALKVATNATMVLAQETGFISSPIISFFMAVMIVLILFAILALIFKFRGT